MPSELKVIGKQYYIPETGHPLSLDVYLTADTTSVMALKETAKPDAAYASYELVYGVPCDSKKVKAP